MLRFAGREPVLVQGHAVLCPIPIPFTLKGGRRNRQGVGANGCSPYKVVSVFAVVSRYAPLLTSPVHGGGTTLPPRVRGGLGWGLCLNLTAKTLITFKGDANAGTAVRQRIYGMGVSFCPHPLCPPLPRGGRGGSAAPLSHPVGARLGARAKMRTRPERCEPKQCIRVSRGVAVREKQQQENPTPRRTKPVDAPFRTTSVARRDARLVGGAHFDGLAASD
jgi:hypothetical protein